MLDLMLSRDSTDEEMKYEHDMAKISKYHFKFFQMIVNPTAIKHTTKHFATFIQEKGQLIIWKCEAQVGQFNELQHMLFRKHDIVNLEVICAGESQQPVLLVVDDQGGVYVLEQMSGFTTFIMKKKISVAIPPGRQI